ncbi:DUF3872 domain-containing protein [Porphyromonas loveana]|nr:DUF3872 domain-containing protein [Porphyromonas loveana]
MKRKMLNTIWVMGVLSLAVFCLSACTRELDVEQAYPFTVETMPVPKEVQSGKMVEIRCKLTARGDFKDTRYTLRCFQYDGVGVLRIGAKGSPLIPNDRYPIPKGEFRLYYTSRSKERQSLELVFEDNHGQNQTMTLEFNHKEKRSGADTQHRNIEIHT